MSYAYIPRMSKCQEKINLFSPMSLSQETFAVFNRHYKEHGNPQPRSNGIRRKPSARGETTTGPGRATVLVADGISRGLNRSLRFWFGGRSDAISRRSAALAGACFSFNPLSS